MHRRLISAMGLFLLSGVGVFSAEPPRGKAAAPAQSSIAELLEQLSSERFATREAAANQLAGYGSAAFEALEQAARQGEFESALRCVEILCSVAGEPALRTGVVETLERIADDADSLARQHAARRLKQLTETAADRALAALGAEGVRFQHDKQGRVYSVSGVRSDRHLFLVAELSDLRFLHASGREVTNAGLRNLVELRKLSHLTLSTSAVTRVGLRSLKDLPALRALRLGNGGYEPDDLDELRHVRQLTDLSLYQSFEDHELAFLEQLPQLKSLSLGDVRLRGAGVDSINCLTHLRSLTLRATQASDEDMRWYGKLRVPLRLTISRSPKVTAKSFEQLAHARIVHLTLQSTPLTDEGLLYVGKMESLTGLMVMDASITDKGLEHLAGIKSLRTLFLRKTRVTEAGVSHLRREMPKLNVFFENRHVVAKPVLPPAVTFKVDAAGNSDAHLRRRLQPEDVQQLKQRPRLRSVFLARGITTDEDLALLAEVPLRGLVVSSRKVTDRGIGTLASHTTLAHLGLWESSISDAGLASVAKVSSLTQLTVQKANITDRGLGQLINALSAKNQLVKLDLFQCDRLTDDGIRRIAQLKSLKELYLNRIDGLTSGVLEQLAVLDGLERLELDGIDLRDADLAHLTQLRRLKTLGLSDTRVGDTGLQLVGQLPGLTSLTIQNSNISSEGVQSLALAPSLKSVGLSGTAISPSDMEKLASRFPNLRRQLRPRRPASEN